MGHELDTFQIWGVKCEYFGGGLSACIHAKKPIIYQIEFNAAFIFRRNLIEIIQQWTVHEEHNKSNSIDNEISHLLCSLKYH